VASRNLNVLREVAEGIRWFITDEVCIVASRALAVIHQLDKEVDKYRNEAAQAIQKLTKVTTERNELDNKDTTNLKNAEARFNANIAQRDAELVSINEKYNDLQQRFSKQQEQANQLHKQKVDFQHQANHLQTKVDELTNTLSKEKEHSNHLRQQKVDLQNEINKISEMNGDLKKKYTELWGQFQKLSSVKERLEVAEHELDEKHKVVLNVSDHVVEALQVASEAIEKARLEAASLRSV
jgi:chromosome segregation ATPase